MRLPAVRRIADVLLLGSGLLGLALVAARAILFVHLARSIPRLLDAPRDGSAFDPALAAHLRAIAHWPLHAMVGGIVITLVAGLGLLLYLLDEKEPGPATQALGTLGLATFLLLLAFEAAGMFMSAPRNDVEAAMNILFERQVHAHLKANPVDRAQPLALPPDVCCKGDRMRWVDADVLVVGGGDPLDPLDPMRRLVVVTRRHERRGSYIPGPEGKRYYLEARDRQGRALQRSFKTTADEVTLAVLEWPARRYLGTCALQGSNSYVDEAGRYHEPRELYESDIERGLAAILAGGFCMPARPGGWRWSP